MYSLISQPKTEYKVHITELLKSMKNARLLKLRLNLLLEKLQLHWLMMALPVGQYCRL